MKAILLRLYLAAALMVLFVMIVIRLAAIPGRNWWYVGVPV